MAVNLPRPVSRIKEWAKESPAGALRTARSTAGRLQGLRERVASVPGSGPPVDVSVDGGDTVIAAQMYGHPSQHQCKLGIIRGLTCQVVSRTPYGYSDLIDATD